MICNVEIKRDSQNSVAERRYGNELLKIQSLNIPLTIGCAFKAFAIQMKIIGRGYIESIVFIFLVDK